jgi:hypothetical protein
LPAKVASRGEARAQRNRVDEARGSASCGPRATGECGRARQVEVDAELVGFEHARVGRPEPLLDG